MQLDLFAQAVEKKQEPVKVNNKTKMMFVFPYESEWNVGSIINWIDWTYTESSASMSFPLRHTVKVLLEVSQGR